jgi:hypothetical protein
LFDIEKSDSKLYTTPKEKENLHIRSNTFEDVIDENQEFSFRASASFKKA